jgi:hypothetical protein
MKKICLVRRRLSRLRVGNFSNNKKDFYIFAAKVKFRVARWFLLQPKIQIRVNFRGPNNEKRLVYSLAIINILRPLGTFYGYLVIK